MFSLIKAGLGGAWIYIVVLAAGMGIGGYGAWWIQGTRYEAKLASQSAANASELKSISDAATKAAQAAIARQDAMQSQIASLDSKYSQELENEKSITANLRRKLSSGAVGLRVRVASCSAGSSAMSKNSAASGMDTSTAAYAELQGPDAINLLGIASDADQDAIKLKALQAWAKSVTQ
ncbi:MAG: lysis protein [Pseudomonadota bacterium]|nr:lysis protein [Pseudomonadota bacterium]